MADDARKTELTAELARSRELFSHNLRKLGDDLNVPRHVKNSFNHNKTAWIGGAAVFGWILSRLPGRGKKVEQDEKKGGTIKEAERAGLLFGVAKLLFAAARPAVTALAARKITDFAAQRSTSRR
jgi:hypothetical protein